MRYGSSSLREGVVSSAADKRMARGSPLLNPRGLYGARDSEASSVSACPSAAHDALGAGEGPVETMHIGLPLSSLSAAGYRLIC